MAVTCFCPAGYAIDIVVPVISIHQAGHWQVNGTTGCGVPAIADERA
jgi:hypothetical protein